MFLFFKKRKTPSFHLFDDGDLQAVRCLLSHGISIKDAPVTAKGGLRIDGQLHRCRIYRTETSGMLRISELGCVQSSLLECTDLLIEGLAKGVVIAASGRIEIASTAMVEGRVLMGAQTQLHIAPGAHVQDLSIKPFNQSVPTPVHGKTASNKKRFVLAQWFKGPALMAGFALGVVVGVAVMWATPSNDAPAPSVVEPIKIPQQVPPAAVPTVPIPVVTPEPVDQAITPATPVPSAVLVKPKPSKVQRKQPLKEEPVPEPSPAEVNDAPLVIIE